MESLRHISKPGFAPSKLAKGFGDCASFIASAPCLAFAGAFALALRRTAAARTNLRMHPAKAVGFVFLTAIPNACFYVQLAQSLFKAL